jgi:hypothetical protein
MTQGKASRRRRGERRLPPLPEGPQLAHYRRPPYFFLGPLQWGVGVVRGKGASMCLTCGCGVPNDDHGDERHITMEDLKTAAEAAEISVDEAVRNFDETIKKA